MAGTERVVELETALEEGHQKLAEQKAELEKAKGEACKKMNREMSSKKAKRSESQLSQRVKEVEMELENSVLRAEVERLRAVEKARNEERNHSQKWTEDLRERFCAEIKSLEERVAVLEAG